MYACSRVLVRMRESYEWHRKGDVGVLIGVDEYNNFPPVNVLTHDGGLGLIWWQVSSCKPGAVMDSDRQSWL